MKFKGPLTLTPAENGGWILEARGWSERGIMGQTLGAFTDSRDMLAELEVMLVGNVEPDLDVIDPAGGRIIRGRRVAPTWALPEARDEKEAAS